MKCINEEGVCKWLKEVDEDKFSCRNAHCEQMTTWRWFNKLHILRMSPCANFTLENTVPSTPSLKTEKEGG